MVRAVGPQWRQLEASSMLDVVESLWVDEVERQVLISSIGREVDQQPGRWMARNQIQNVLYDVEPTEPISRDERAKTWGLLPEHQAGLRTAVEVTKL